MSDEGTVRATGDRVLLQFPGQGSFGPFMLRSFSREGYVGTRLRWAEKAVGEPVCARLKSVGDLESVPPLLSHVAGCAGSVGYVELLLATAPIQPDRLVCLGHSMGHIAALTEAGAIDDETGLAYAAERGAAMETLSGSGCLVSVTCTERQIDLLLGSVPDTSVANLNSSNSRVLAVRTSSVERLLVAAKRVGVERARVLPITIPAHSMSMVSASSLVRPFVEQMVIKDPVATLIAPDGQTPTDSASVRRTILSEMVTEVDYPAMLSAALRLDPAFVLEAGPGDVLTRLLRMNQPALKSESLWRQSRDGATRDKLIEWLNQVA